MFVLEDENILDKMITNKGEPVSELSNKSPILLIFLRHLGCMFCKEALSDLKKIKEKIYQKGTNIVFVHMAESKVASDFFEAYSFDKISHISDMDNVFYSQFGLSKGDFKQLFGFKSWFGMGRAAAKGNLPSAQLGDPHQMPGIFLVHNRKIVKSFIFRSVGDYPDYLSMSAL